MVGYRTSSGLLAMLSGVSADPAFAIVEAISRQPNPMPGWDITRETHQGVTRLRGVLVHRGKYNGAAIREANARNGVGSSKIRKARQS